jgi:hypothetical protein
MGSAKELNRASCPGRLRQSRAQPAGPWAAETSRQGCAPAVLDKLEVLVYVVEQLRDHKVGACVHLLLQVVDVSPVVLLHLQRRGGRPRRGASTQRSSALQHDSPSSKPANACGPGRQQCQRREEHKLGTDSIGPKATQLASMHRLNMNCLSIAMPMTTSQRRQMQQPHGCGRSPSALRCTMRPQLRPKVQTCTAPSAPARGPPRWRPGAPRGNR